MGLLIDCQTFNTSGITIANIISTMCYAQIERREFSFEVAVLAII